MYCFRRFDALPRTLRICVGLSIALVIAVSSFALEPSTPLVRLGRQAWTMENGLPQNTIPVLAQSRSGFLWVGTELGLARFDGTGFRLFDHATTPSFPDAEVRCLLDDAGKSATGTLWIGTSDGLVLLRGGQATPLTTRTGLPSNSIRGLAQSTDGTVWVWTELGLARWLGEKQSPQFAAMTQGSEIPSGTITSIAADANGGFWVATASGAAVFRQGHWQTAAETQSRPGYAMVSAVPSGDVLLSTPDGIYLEHEGHSAEVVARTALPDDRISFLTQLGDGTVAAASKTALILANQGTKDAHTVVRLAAGSQLPGTRIEVLFADREGCLWVGTNHGLARVSIRIPSGVVQLLPATDPLAISAVVSLIEDREGDLWAGTETAGLHILRDTHFRAIGSSEGLSSDNTTAIVQSADGSMWIGTRDEGLNRIAADGKISSLTATNGLLSNVILSLAAGPGGDLWVGTPDGLNRVRNGKVTSYTSADGLPDDFIRSLLPGPDESLWIGTRRGLTHLESPGKKVASFTSFTQADGLGSDLVGALARTPDGDLWIATLNGLTRLHQGHLRNYTTADGLSSNVITALDATGDGMLWIGTQGDGLNLWDGKRMAPIREGGTSLGQLPAALHAILHDDFGHLWMASDFGLARADIAALEGCAQQGKCAITVAHFTTADGLRSRQTSLNSHPTACRGSDGELWFATPRGVVIADPRHFATAPATPAAIERFAVDDQEFGTQYGGVMRIGAGHLRFQFDYTGLSFAAPQKLRYQYMLEGFDHGWTDAGPRRTAYYTNIPPGPYRFRVRTNLGSFADSGTQPEADLAFELLPHFYQTVWFVVLLVLLGSGMVFLVFRGRVLRVEREFRAVMAERNRIAREIHDTLAQGYVGISVQLEVLGELLRHNRTELAAKHLKLTQGQVREGLDDARQSIWALRSQDAGERTLPVKLRRLVEKAHGRGLDASLEVHGAYRALSPEAEKEILRIAQEAIHNVEKHAEATQLALRLEYDARLLALAVTDNGKGFLVSKSAAEGHYGLTGMRERVALIHGRFEITSQPGEGTTVRVEIPAPSANSRMPSGTALNQEQDTNPVE